MELTADILALRPWLLGIAYNLLGVVEEAEDVVQDVFEKWLPVENVTTPKAYLGRMAVNRSINRMEELRRQRESYKGYWLPEPYLTLEQSPGFSLEYGLLMLMERLNPLERAVFVLREGFSEEYADIAELTGLSQDNCRQLLHRAREKVGRSNTEPIDRVRQSDFTESFLKALHAEDVAALGRLLRQDIELYNDGGGKRAAALKPLFGIDKVLKFLAGIAGLEENRNNEFYFKPVFANGYPAALVYRRSTGEPDGMQYVIFEGDAISRLLYVRNPDKLRVRS